MQALDHKSNSLPLGYHAWLLIELSFILVAVDDKKNVIELHPFVGVTFVECLPLILRAQ